MSPEAATLDPMTVPRDVVPALLDPGDLARVRRGDTDALARIVDAMYRPLCTWSHGRLPSWARDLSQTYDLVHDCLYGTLRRAAECDFRSEVELWNYLRVGVMNRVRNEIRRIARRPRLVDVDEEVPGTIRTPLDDLLARDLEERYHTALATLPPEKRRAVQLRVDRGYSYEQIMKALGKPTIAATRMMTNRALAELADALDLNSGRREPRRARRGSADR